MTQFGRRVPTDWKHVERYPLRALIDDPEHRLTIPASGIEKSLGLPAYWNLWDQGADGACVGFGSSAMMGITNTLQMRLATGGSGSLRFAPRWLYHEAQLADEWPETPPEEGTTVRASCDVLRKQGHCRVRYGKTEPVDLKWGISADRWAVSVDEIRAAIYGGSAVSFGVDWYRNFMTPVLLDGERWIGTASLGKIVGGHCVCLYRMSDRRQAFKLMNSWGADYPPAWIPYSVVQQLLNQDGEGACITDR